jgi:hypothetical protein
MSEHTIRFSQQQPIRTCSLGTITPRKFNQLIDVNMIEVQDDDIIVYDAENQTYVPILKYNIFSEPSSYNIGIGTTNPGAKLHVNGDVLITGISTIGIGTTSFPNINSTMSFELTSNTSLTVRVKGNDGVIRTGIITLS